jgi:hypothetical protein
MTLRHAVTPDFIPCIQTGVSLMTALISSAIAAAIGGGLAWYIRGRGMAGVQIDLNNVKNDISNIKGRLDGTPAATPVVVTPPAV